MMTTNSPNPVDGDVQALIAFLQEKITSLKFAAKQHAFEGIREELLMELSSAEIALSALTAEPVYQFIVNNPDKDGYIEWADCNPDYFSNEPSDSRRILYTTPPAQLLRPVELPKRKSMLTREEIDEDYKTCMAVTLDEVIAALEAAGVPYEVKND